MTYCSPLAVPLQKHIEEKKTLDEIGLKICGDTVKNPRRKAIRLIRLLLGEKTLIDNADSLNYSYNKININKTRKQPMQQNCSAKDECTSHEMQKYRIPECGLGITNTIETGNCPSEEGELTRVVDAVSVLISRHGEVLFMEALAILKIILPSEKETSSDKKFQINLDSTCKKISESV